MKHGALMHNEEDDVAVVISDIKAQTEIKAVSLDGQEIVTIKTVEDIPLGHKIAVRDIVKGKEVIKYGRPIGRAIQDIAQGAHVHIQNIKSIRWA